MRNFSSISDTQKKNEAAYIETLNKLFDIAKTNALVLMKDEDDKKILQAQRGK